MRKKWRREERVTEVAEMREEEKEETGRKLEIDSNGLVVEYLCMCCLSA